MAIETAPLLFIVMPTIYCLTDICGLQRRWCQDDHQATVGTGRARCRLTVDQPEPASPWVLNALWREQLLCFLEWNWLWRICYRNIWNTILADFLCLIEAFTLHKFETWIFHCRFYWSWSFTNYPSFPTGWPWIIQKTPMYFQTESLG